MSLPTIRGSQPARLTGRMTQSPILVLGGTGKTGRRVAARLANLGHPVRAASRSAATTFNWHDPRTWERAVAGATGVYLVLDDADDGSALRAFVDLAVDREVSRLVLLSAREWEPLGAAGPLAAERVVRDSGMEWTILRPAWFAQNFTEEAFLADEVARGEVVHTAGDGAHPYIDAADIAAVAVAALTEPGHAGQTYELSGPRALTMSGAVGEIAAATGRQIRAVAVPPEEYVAYLVGRGYYPQPVVEAVTQLFTHISAGHDAHLSDGVQRALGRAPRDFSEFVKGIVTERDRVGA